MWLVEQCGCGNVGSKPDLEDGKLDRLMGVNAEVQLHHALKVSSNIVSAV